MIKHVLKLIWNKKRSNSLMLLEIFLSFLVLFAVLSYSFFNINLVSKPLGFETVNRWVISLEDLSKKDSTEAAEILKNLRSELLALEEVEDLTIQQNIRPFNNSTWYDGNDDNGFGMNARIVPAGYNYAEVMNVPIVEGRWFKEEDLNATYDPIIVDKNFMDEYYPGKSMIDSVFIFNGERKLIGVVDQYRYGGEFEEVIRTTFNLIEETNKDNNTIILKMKAGSPVSVEQKISNIVNNITNTTGATIVSLEKERIEDSRTSWIQLIALLSICGFLCINVALGLFGVLWYNINKRRAEIGLRQAIGAHSSDISKQFILEILILAGLAMMIGVFFAIQVPLLEVTEFPAEHYYKAIVVSVLVISTLVVVCAFYPSIQASRISPAIALHED